MEGQNKRGEKREGEHVQNTVVSRANVYCGLKDYNLVALSLKVNMP